MRTPFVFLLATCAAFVSSGEDGFSVLVDREEDPTAVMRSGFPGFAYADAPVPGDEAAVLKYRHAGAWTFRTASASCDKAMLDFAKKYGLRLVLLLEGESKEIVAKLNLLEDEAYRDLVVGVQLGEREIPTDDVPTWTPIVAGVRRRFPGVPIAMPAAKGVPESAKSLSGVTHLVFDLRKNASPYGALHAAYAESMRSGSSRVRNIRFWAVAGASVPGEPADDGFRGALWSLHWMMTAFASERFDAVFFDRPAKDDPFGWAMRFAALGFRDHPRVLLHGEASSSKSSAGASASVGDLEMSLDMEDDGGEKDAGDVVLKAKPRACANFAAKRGGDVEYLVLDNGGRTAWDTRVCILVVNSGEKAVKMSVETKRGKCGNGDARRVFVDPETGKVRHEGLGFFVRPGMPLVRRVAPKSFETLTFVMP